MFEEEIVQLGTRARMETADFWQHRSSELRPAKTF